MRTSDIPIYENGEIVISVTRPDNTNPALFVTVDGACGELSVGEAADLVVNIHAWLEKVLP